MRISFFVYFFSFCIIIIPFNVRASTTLTTRVVIQWDTTVTQETIDSVLIETEAHLRASDANAHISLRSFRDKKHLAIINLNTTHTQKTIHTLNAEPHVIYAHEDIVFSTDEQTIPWGISGTGINSVAAHNDNAKGDGVLVAIVDSGVDLDHPDLIDNIWHPSGNTCVLNETTIIGGCPHGGYDFINSDNRPEDDNGHGTHVAGTVAAADNGIGVIGVAPEATLMIVKVLDNTGYGSYTTIIEGIRFAIDNGADIINLSLGSVYAGKIPQDLLDVIQAAEDAGVLVVAATGNNSTPIPYLPSQFGTVLSVGAVQETADQDNPDADYNTRLAYFSNWGKVDVVAPGVRINSTTFDGGYSGDTWEGTSMATPAVSGVAALLLGEQPDLTPAQLRFIITSTATDLGETGDDSFFGAGLVNADNALAALHANTTTLYGEFAWSENTFDDVGEGYYDTTSIYTERIPSDGESGTTIRVQLREANGTPIVHESVNATLSSGTILTTLPVSTDTNGFAYIDIQSPASAGKAILTLTAGSTSDTTTLTYADTLYVHDNGDINETDTSAWTMTRALEENGVYWMQSVSSSPEDATELSHYATVLWNAGTFGVNIEEQELLIDFLRAGGHLALFGGNALSTYAYYAEHGGASGLGIDELWGDYLGVSFVSSHAPSETLVTQGNLGTLSIESSVAHDDEFSQQRTDVIAARTGSHVLGYFCDNAQDAIVEHEDGYRAITVATTLDLYAAHDRTTLIGRVLNALDGTTPVDTAIADTCDQADNNTTTESHAASDLSEAPEILDTEADALENVIATIDDSILTITWNNDASYEASSATLLNTSTRETTTTTGTATSITFDNVSQSARYVVALTVSANAQNLNPYYIFVTTETTSITNFELSKRKRHTLSFSTNTTLTNEETFEYELLDKNNEKVQTLTTTNTSITFSDLVARTPYTARVRVRSGDNVSAWTPVITARTLTNRVRRPNVTVENPTALRVTWQKPQHSAVKKYRVQLFQRNNGEYAFYGEQVITENMNAETLSTIFAHLNPDKRYRVRVRPTFKNGEKGEYSLWRKILAKDF